MLFADLQCWFTVKPEKKKELNSEEIKPIALAIIELRLSESISQIAR